MVDGIFRGRSGTACVLALLLGACGGGGGVASVPAPIATGPTPSTTNTDIAALVASQSFANDAAVGAIPIDLTARTTGSGTAAGGTLTVSYDAAARSYTVVEPARTTTFSSADVQSSIGGETRYAHSAGASRDYLTIVTTPYSNTTGNRYVALGYSQHNELSGNSQQTGFDAFAFGLDTPAAAVPRTGSASWRTDVFGLYTQPNQTPRTIQGSGDFTVNFAKALFTTSTYVTQYDFLTGASLVGGGLEVRAQGAIGSGNGFSGNLAYNIGADAVAGQIAGRFYGPGAEEIGAAFHADNAAGATLTGALTGQRATTTTAANFTLDSIASDQLFYAQWATLTQTVGLMYPQTSVRSPDVGQATFRADGSFRINTPTSGIPNADFAVSDRLAASRPSFDSYQKQVDGRPVRVDLYHPASEQGVALTYAGFGAYSYMQPAGDRGSEFDNGWFTYGFVTPENILARRTGTGSYDGVAYGTAAPANASGTRYDVGGTAHFDVDFSAQRYTGSLALNATPEGGGTAAALGTWTFGAAMMNGRPTQASLAAAAPNGSTSIISPQLFGPDGQEIAAPFTITNGAQVNGQAVTVAGVAAARRR